MVLPDQKQKSGGYAYLESLVVAFDPCFIRPPLPSASPAPYG